MNRRFVMILTLAALAVLCCGCRLAREEVAARDDRMVGVTLSVVDWGEPTGYDEEGNPYWDLTGQDDPMPTEGELGSYTYCVLREETEEGPASAAEGFWPGDMHTHLSVSDDGESVELTGTVCLSREKFNEDAFAEVYVRPVFRDGEGALYSDTSSGGMAGNIGESTVSMAQTETAAKNGETLSRAFSWSVTLKVVDPVLSARVLSFDEAGALIGSEELALSAEGMACAAPESAAFLVLEAVSVGADGQTAVSRQIASRGEWDGDASPFTLYLPLPDGICLPVGVEIRG